MLLRPGLRLEPRWGSSQRSPALARFRWSLRFAARKGGKRDRKGGRQGEREGRVKIGRRRKSRGAEVRGEGEKGEGNREGGGWRSGLRED